MAVEGLPKDEHNGRLGANVPPPDWVSPEPPARYNLVVIGAGTAGLVTAAGAAGLGARVALVERELLGGDCLNVGCVPSKALIRAARAAAQVRDAAQFGIHVPPGVRVDFAGVMERMRRLRAGISAHDSAARFRGLGVDVYLGQGTFTGPNTVEVAGQTLRFRRAVIATGARAERPAIPGLAEAGFLTNETVFSLTELPPRLAVIGAGPIGCELAQAFARLGSQVYLIEVLHGLLPNEDRDAAAIVQVAMARDHITFLCCGTQLAVERAEAAKRLTVDSHGQHSDLTVDEILVGVGRTPNTEGLNLEAASVAYDKTGVRVNPRLQTTNRKIYAAGDICSRYKFTHVADALAQVVIQNALFPHPLGLGYASSESLTIPWCTYTDPEIAHVGLYEEEAKKKGIEVETYTSTLDEVDRAILDSQEEGFARLHVKKGTDQLVGATVVAAHAGEMISEITVLMQSGKGLKTLTGTIHPYPTQAEAIKKAGNLWRKAHFTAGMKNVLRKWFEWTRLGRRRSGLRAL